MVFFRRLQHRKLKIGLQGTYELQPADVTQASGIQTSLICAM